MTQISQPPLIKTKLLVPQLRQQIVRRERISEILSTAARYPLTLVSSQAGSGKTTALVTWLKEQSLLAAWYSIDEGDNELTRFLLYFITALQTAAQGAGRAALEALSSSEPLAVESILSLLINDLAERPADFFVILDDYHLIKTQAIHQAVAFLIEHMPGPLHLVISTRADPSLPLARLRARNQVLELRVDQLRFTPGEAAEYLNQVMRLGLEEREVNILRDRTEGWIAGLQMAALSFRGQPKTGVFIQAFSGNNRYILDYLAEEVINQQPGDIQAFLMQTCILDRLCAPLCNAVTGHENGQETLEYLERCNLFLIPLDSERKWYRFHHLFAGLLRARLSHASQGRDPKYLYARASTWFEENGLSEEAIHYALAVRDYPRAARLVEAAAENAWINGQYASILGWIRALPEELVCERPWLCIWEAWALTQVGTLENAARWMDLAQQAAEKQGIEFSPQPGGQSPDALAVVFEINTLRALHAGLSGDYEQAVRLAGPVIESLRQPNKKTTQMAQCHITHGLSTLYFTTGEFKKAIQFCIETVRLAREAGFTLRLLHAINKYALAHFAMGSLHAAYWILEDTLAQLEKEGQAGYFAVAILRLRQIDALYEWNRLEEARLIAQTLLQAEVVPEVPYLYVDLLNAQARDLLFRQDFPAAQDALDRAFDLARQSYIWQALTWKTETLQVKLWLRTGQIARAAAWAAQNPVEPGPFASESRAIAHARILLAQDKCQEAAGLLGQLAAAAEAGGRRTNLIEILLLKAAAFQQAGQVEQALEPVKSALVLAEESGHRRTFLDEGEPLFNLIAQIGLEKRSRKRCPSLACADELLAVFKEEEMAAAPPAPEPFPGRDYEKLIQSAFNTSLFVPLTRRELEVLHCIAEGDTNPEIARRLVIEVSTVKRHINNLFGKLGVSSRVMALNKAKEHGLL